MFEVSPVSATAAPLAASVNFTSGGGTPATTGTSSVSGNDAVDARRYSKFDRTASAVGSASMSFGDVLDMINPLQHIPVVSSIYREIAGDKINPVSRVAGDVLYGGAMGVATAVVGGISAIADSVMEAKTGNDVKGAVYADLFGEEKAAAGDGTTQMAAAEATPNTASVAETPAPVSPPQQPVMTADAATTASVASATAAPATEASDAKVASQETKGFALPPNGRPFGGAIAPVKTMQEQNMAMALAKAGASGVRIGNTVYANRFMNGAHLTPAVGSAAPAAAAPAPAATDGQPALITALPAAAPEAPKAKVASSVPVGATPAALPSTPVPAGLNDDASIMRALSLYQSVATGSGFGRAGAGVNVLN